MFIKQSCIINKRKTLYIVFHFKVKPYMCVFLFFESDKMRCPFCNSEDTSVVETRFLSNENSLRRRRECNKCKKRFTTYERIEYEEIRVIKKNNVRERFDPEKIRRGLLKALEKRPVDEEQIEKLLQKIVSKIRSLEQKEVTSEKIGKIVMSGLRSLDKVAYVRFASVYKDFASLEDYIEEIKKIDKKFSLEKKV